MMGEYMNEQMGNDVKPFTQLAIKMTPVIVMGLNLWHELSSKPNYVDHPGLDLLAGSAAALTYIMTTDTKDNLKLAFDKLGTAIRQKNNPQMKDSEIIGM